MNIIYHSFSAGIIASFFEQLLFFGIFVVALVMIRRSMLDISWFKSGDFVRHLILIFSVSMFTSFIYISYSIESAKGLSDVGASLLILEKEQIISSLSGDNKLLSMMQLLIMLPIDLVGMALVACMYGTLAVMHFRSQEWGVSNLLTVRASQYLILILFFWHFTMVVWWAMYAITNGQVPFVSYFNDIRVHLLYMFVEFVFYQFLIKTIRKNSALKTRERLAWFAVGFVAITYLSLYVVRLMAYTSKFIDTIIA